MQINSDLTTPATSDPDLKSSIHSTHSNSKTLELFDKSSVVDFTIDEILIELGNENEIHNDSILLFLPIDKQEISPSHSPSQCPFQVFESNLSRKRTGAKKRRICTKKDLSEGFKEIKSVRLISSEDRRLPMFFNDIASHINKTDNSNNKNKMPASPNLTSSETSVEQKINVPDKSS